MKKSSCLLCMIFMVFSLCSCSGRNEALKNNQGNMQGQSITENKTANARLKDGTYKGEGDASTDGIRQDAVVKVSGGKIVSVALKNVDSKGTELSDAFVSSSDRVNNLNNAVTGNRGANDTTGSSAGNSTGSNTGNANILHNDPSNVVTGPNPNAGVVTSESIGQLKTELANAIVYNQGTNVSVNTGDINMINNWKTAVDRALAKAR